MIKLKSSFEGDFSVIRSVSSIRVCRRKRRAKRSSYAQDIAKLRKAYTERKPAHASETHPGTCQQQSSSCHPCRCGCRSVTWSRIHYISRSNDRSLLHIKFRIVAAFFRHTPTKYIYLSYLSGREVSGGARECSGHVASRRNEFSYVR